MPTTTTRTCTGNHVRHADGTSECDQAATCGGELLLHEWTLDCAALGCDCGAPTRHGLESLRLPIAA
jgi:hypothetical protein